MIARGFNVITKVIFKALCFSHDYYVPAMITSVIANEAESEVSLCVLCPDTTVLLLVPRHSTYFPEFCSLLS